MRQEKSDVFQSRQRGGDMSQLPQHVSPKILSNQSPHICEVFTEIFFEPLRPVEVGDSRAVSLL